MAAVLQKIPDLHVGEVELKSTLKETITHFVDDDGMGMAAQMSYHALLAIFPFLFFLAGLTSVIDTVFNIPNLSDKIVNLAGHVMPPNAQDTLRSFTEPLVTSRGGWIAILLGLGGALWSSSNAVQAAMKSLNRAYDVQTRKFPRSKIFAIAMTIVFTLLILVATLLFGSGQWLAGGVGGLFGWNPWFAFLWNLFSPLLALALALSAVALLYWKGPNTQVELKTVLPGAILFVLAWIIFSIGFSYYLANFASYDKVYGSIAAVIILLVWLYWTNTILLFGGEMNATLQRHGWVTDLDERGKTRTRRTQPPRQNSGGANAGQIGSLRADDDRADSNGR